MENANYPAFVTRFYDTVYNSLRTGTDFQFYINEIMNTQGSVLEVGVGTGRFFCEALKNGADIYGVDPDENMLEMLRGKLNTQEKARLYAQDARVLDLDKKFDLIIAPFRVFSHLLSIEDQLAALNRIATHLKPSGEFIFDLYVPNLSYLSKDRPEQQDFEGFYEEGKRLRRFHSSHTDITKQINHIHMTYVWEEDGTEKRGVWDFDMRYYFRYELEHLIARSNLKLETIYGGFEKELLDKNAKEFVIVCNR